MTGEPFPRTSRLGGHRVFSVQASRCMPSLEYHSRHPPSCWPFRSVPQAPIVLSPLSLVGKKAVTCCLLLVFCLRLARFRGSLVTTYRIAQMPE